MKFLPFILALSCPTLFATPLTVFSNGKIVTVNAAFSIADAPHGQRFLHARSSP